MDVQHAHRTSFHAVNGPFVALQSQLHKNFHFGHRPAAQSGQDLHQWYENNQVELTLEFYADESWRVQRPWSFDSSWSEAIWLSDVFTATVYVPCGFRASFPPVSGVVLVRRCEWCHGLNVIWIFIWLPTFIWTCNRLLWSQSRRGVP